MGEVTPADLAAYVEMLRAALLRWVACDGLPASGTLHQPRAPDAQTARTWVRSQR